MKKIYIAGKISGLSYEDAYSNFLLAETLMKSRGIVINPMKICNPKWSYMRIMLKCLWVLITQCNRIYLQTNWFESKGARIEVLFAILFNKNIINISNL